MDLGQGLFPSWRLQHYREGNSIDDTYNLSDRNWVVSSTGHGLTGPAGGPAICYPNVSSSGSTFGRLRLTGSAYSPYVVASMDCMFRSDINGTMVALTAGGYGTGALWYEGEGVAVGNSIDSNIMPGVGLDEWFNLKMVVVGSTTQSYFNGECIEGVLAGAFELVEFGAPVDEFWIYCDTTRSADATTWPRFRNIQLWLGDQAATL